MRRARPVLVALAFVWAATISVAALDDRPPAFELTALGVLGGDVDTNLSSYLLARAGEVPRVMIDGGHVVAGIWAWKERTGALEPDASVSRRTRMAADVLKHVQVAFFTHAHMDHVAGFIQKTTLDLLLALEGRPPLEVAGLPVTLAAIKDLLLKPPLWIDFTAAPPGNPALKLAPLPPGTWRDAGPFKARSIEVSHPDRGAAFLFTAGGEAYLHVGDTRRCAELWNTVRPWFRAGHLRAITLECSWPAKMEKLAVTTGHLTPSSWLLELNELAGVVRDPPAAETMTREERRRLARALAPHFRGCPLIVTHIKAMEYDATLAELDDLKREGLNVVIPQQGATYRF